MDPRERLVALRAPLLDLHREILGAERFDFERLHGSVGAAQFLQIVTDSLRYSWLLPLSELIVEVDATLDGEEEAALPDELLDRLRSLVAPPDAATAFGHQYLRLLQNAPGVVMAHAALAREL